MKKLPVPFVFLLMAIIMSFQTGKDVPPPKPYGAIPSERQLAHHELEFYGFIHFTVNTFTDKEWGGGDESPEIFNPTHLDARQWARVAKEAGMKGLILTAKHHDGFCLWPSAYTEHSVKNSPWKNGKGDVLKEFSEACQEYGLKMGLYLSPWDRNSALYGDTAYITYYRNQLKEILSDYGDVFEVWFDGANGGTGYYGGARERRKIDNKTYYDWENTRKIVRELQPDAVMFSDGGPDIRWVGNEKGIADEINWCTLDVERFYPGCPNHFELLRGNEYGSHWVPAECDVSIRPGWFYHEKQDDQVKSVEQLLDIYYKSVGRGATLLLNIPPDKTGKINKVDAKRLKAFKKALDAEFPENLALHKKVTATNYRGNYEEYAPAHVTDGDKATYWAADDSISTASLIIDLEEPTVVNRIVLQEYIRLGQRIKTFNVEALINDKWVLMATGATIGYKRILKFPSVKTGKIRVNFLESHACPVINNIALYRAPDKGPVLNDN